MGQKLGTPVKVPLGQGSDTLSRVFYFTFIILVLTLQKKAPPVSEDGGELIFKTYIKSAEPDLKFGAVRFTAAENKRPLPCVAPASGAVDFWKPTRIP